MKTYERLYSYLSQQEDHVSGEKLAKELGISRTSVWKGMQQLEKKGLQIDSIRHRGYRLQSGDLILPEQISQETGLVTHYNPASISTQLDAKAGIERHTPTPSLYLAPTQGGARGRFGRSFFASETGGIYMTLHLSPQVPMVNMKPYTLFTAAAIVKAIANLTGIETEIKWVNDIYLNNRKIAGVLTEAISSVETQTVTDTIIGVGINFAIDQFPEELCQKAGSLFHQQPTITRNQLIAEIWNNFFHTPEDELLALYKEKSLVLGKQVTFIENQVPFIGVAKSITDKGELCVQLANGQEKIISSGEISLSSWSLLSANEKNATHDS